MHRPERWGFVEFCNSAKDVTVKLDPSLAARDTVMGIYYRQKEFRAKNGRYATSLAELGISAAEASDAAHAISLNSTRDGYEATAFFKNAGGVNRVMHLRQDSKLWESK
jgi:hypothetical protein